MYSFDFLLLFEREMFLKCDNLNTKSLVTLSELSTKAHFQNWLKLDKIFTCNFLQLNFMMMMKWG